MMKKLLLILCFFLSNLSTLVFCQNNSEAEAAKLKTKIHTEKGNEKIKNMLSLCFIYNSLSPDSANHYAVMALNLSKQIKNDTLIGRSYLYLGQAHLLSGNDSLCISAFLKSEEIFKKINDSSNLANALTAIGEYFYYKADFNSSYKAYYSA